MQEQDSSSVQGRVDADGRLVSADPALADLHARAGGEPGGPLAVPQLAQLARLVRRLSIPVSRAVLAADGEDDLDLWVRAKPDGASVELAIAGWTHRSAAFAPMPAPHHDREADFLRAEADWTWETDAALRLSSLSAAGMAALSGEASGPVLGDALTRLFVLEDGREAGPPLLEALANQAGFEDQYVVLRGSTRRFRLAGVPILGSGGALTGFRGGGFAIADEPTLTPAAPKPANDGPSAFAQRLETALRGPIHRIVATAEQIREQEDGPVRADYNGYAGDIANAGRHLLGLIEDLVDLEAVERADLEVEQETLDMADLARRAGGLLSVRADDKDMRIEQPDIAEKLEAIGDFKRSLQVLVNLVGNAVRYGPESSTVRVSIEARGAHVAAIVADQGRGIAPENHELVFAKFERLGTREPGSGLGLYISRRLARAMGGDILIESGADKGARFVFTLPAK
ncbi:HAMP domain-containing histidine kinase [Sphingomonas sp. CGMCC 1.13654]|uniref:histidine kinase n=1 Tax=Sphingomonas chungangi TaxID=2683589 RepID=A0A838LCL5_9SPHN|nr:HAMP domain-containing sensor histidine kinase [Sphingomonas chungangi]MBA2936475.1 HAMP domain-containing histidine kinase [Sphingomonas chungangi]MVW55860.1 PAS domain-containing sensor histidine kinase [Sphingomonas chungangi]